MPLPRALVGLGLLSEEDLQRELARADQDPALTAVHTRADLLGMLPVGLCNRLAALPVDLGPDGTVEVAVLDPRDAHIAEEIGYHLQHPVRLVRAPYALLREALVRSVTPPPARPPPGARQERHRIVAHTPAWGTPMVTMPLPGPSPSRPVMSVAVIPSSGHRQRHHLDSPVLRRDALGRLSPPARSPAGGRHATGGRPAHPRSGLGAASRPVHDAAGHRADHQADARRAGLPPGGRPAADPARRPSPQPVADPLPDPTSTLAQLRAATSRDEVLSLIEKSARAVAVRVGLFVYRKDTLVGWSCSPEFGAAAALRELSIPVHSPSLLDTVLGGGVYLGPLLGSVGASILRAMRTATRDVAIVAVHVSGKPAVVVVCDELGDTLRATRHLDVLAKVAGEALERVIRKRRG